MIELHYKCTTWCKLKLPDSTNKEDLIEKLNEGYLPLELGYNDVVKGVQDVEWEVINDTEEYLSPEENDGEATIELMEETERGWLESIWDNSYESEFKNYKNEYK